MEGLRKTKTSEDKYSNRVYIDEETKTRVELRPKSRLDSLGTQALKEVERQLEIIEQGQLATLHLDPADEDPRLAAAIPRPGDPPFQRGEPVRSSAGGVVAVPRTRLRPRTHSDNAGPLCTGRAPVRRPSRSLSNEV